MAVNKLLNTPISLGVSASNANSAMKSSNTAGAVPYMNFFSGTEFRVNGTVELTAPMLAWIVENTQSYNFTFRECEISPTQYFGFKVTFDKDVDAVAFKLRWSDEVQPNF